MAQSWRSFQTEVDLLQYFKIQVNQFIFCNIFSYILKWLLTGFLSFYIHTYIYICMSHEFVHVCVNVHQVSSGTYGGQRRTSGPSRLELKDVVRHPAWGLGTELGFFRRTATALTQWATIQSLTEISYETQGKRQCLTPCAGVVGRNV